MEENLLPILSYFFLDMKTPQEDTGMRQTNNHAQPLPLRVKIFMMQETPNKCGGFILGDINADEAVAPMTKTAAVKIAVQREERRTAKPEQ